MNKQRRLEVEQRVVNTQIDFFEQLKYLVIRYIDNKVQDELGTLYKRKAELRSNEFSFYLFFSFCCFLATFFLSFI